MPAAHSLCATCVQDHAGTILNFFLDSLGALKAPLLVVGDDLKGVGNSAVGKAILVQCCLCFMGCGGCWLGLTLLFALRFSLPLLFVC